MFVLSRLNRNRAIFLVPLFLIVLLSAAVVNSQTIGHISGKVLDAETGNPLPDADLQILETGLGTASDASGQFEFNQVPAGQVRIQCAYMGYANQVVTVSVTNREKAQVRIPLTPTVLTQPNLTVTSMKSGQDVRDVPMPMEVVSERRIRTLAPATVSDALAEEPGLALKRDGSWGTDINIRGASGQKVVALVDGHRIETATNIAAGLSLVDVNNVERIEVLKGASSVLYGSGAMGGVVNIITKQNTFQENLYWHASVLSGYSSADNRGTGRLSVNAGDSRWYLGVSTMLRKADNVKTPEGTLANSQFSDNSLSMYLGYKLANAHQLKFELQRFRAEDVGIPGGSPFPDAATATYPEEKRDLASFTYQYAPESVHFKSLSFRMYRQFIYRDVELSTPAALVNPAAEHEMVGAQLESNWTWAGHTLIAGLDGWQRDLNSTRTKTVLAANKVVGERPIPVASYRSIGFFVQDQLQVFTPKLKATLGARVDQIQVENEAAWQPEYVIQNGVRTDKPGNNQLWEAGTENDISYSANAGLIWLLTPDVEATLNLARAFRSPNLEERYQYIELGGATYWGNPDLNPEIGNFVDAGLRFWKPGWTFKANVFLNAMTDLVVDELESEGVYRMANVGKARLYGFDAGLEVNLWKSLTGYGSLAYVRGEDLELNIDLPQIPPMTGHAGLRFWIGSLLQVNASATFSSKQDKVAAGEDQTDGYFRLDSYINTKTLPMGRLTGRLVLGVENITDEAYRLHLSTYRGLARLEPGRNFKITWMMDI